jgi:hypothetical protein
MEELNYIFHSPTTCYLSVFLPVRTVLRKNLNYRVGVRFKGEKGLEGRWGKGLRGRSGEIPTLLQNYIVRD